MARMTQTYTVDARVFLNAFNPYEVGHEDSNRLLARFQERTTPIIVPTLLLPEVAAAIAWGMKPIRILIFLLLPLLLGGRVEAQPSLVLILLQEGMPPQRLEGEVPHRAAWLLWGRVESPRTESRALSLATGRRLRAEPEDGLFLEASAPFEHGSARQAFERWTGVRPPEDALLARNAGSLLRRGILQNTLGAKLEQMGKRGVYLRVQPNDSPTHQLTNSPTPFLLIAVGKYGYLPLQEFPSLAQLMQAVPLLPYDWVIFELDRWDYPLLELLLAEGIETWIISLSAPDASLSNGARLSGIVRYQAREESGLLTSPTTRWSGLIAEIDVAPSILQSLFPEAPALWEEAGGTPALLVGTELLHEFWNGRLLARTGRKMGGQLGLRRSGDALHRIEAWWHVQHELAPPLLGTVAALGAIWIIAGLVWWRMGHLWRFARRLYVSGLAVLSLFPAVTLWLSYCPLEMWTGQPAQDAAVVVGWMMLGWVLLSLLMVLLARRFQITPLGGAALVSVGVILLDIFLAGGYGANRSLFGLYFWEGARLYGLDNNYLGLLIAFSVLGTAGWLQTRAWEGLSGLRLILLMTVYGLLTLTLGLPLLGANAGGIATAVVVFGVAGHLLANRPLRAGHLVSLFLLAVFVTLGMMWLDAHLPWQWRSHLGRAWWSLTQSEGGSALLSSKWQAAVRVATAPVLWIALLGFGLFFAGVYTWFREVLSRFWERAVALRKGIIACAWGAVAAVVFNDSGLVTACLIAGGIVLWSLEYLIGGKEWGYPEGNGRVKLKV